MKCLAAMKRAGTIMNCCLDNWEELIGSFYRWGCWFQKRAAENSKGLGFQKEIFFFFPFFFFFVLASREKRKGGGEREQGFAGKGPWCRFIGEKPELLL